MDVHFRETPFESNIPVLLGLASVWNVSFLGYPARAILPYTQALSKLAPHIQQACPAVPAFGAGSGCPGCQLLHALMCLLASCLAELLCRGWAGLGCNRCQGTDLVTHMLGCLTVRAHSLSGSNHGLAAGKGW